MKNIIIIAILALLLNGCRYVNTKETYPDSKASTNLNIPEGLDTPNTSSTLEVPHVDSSFNIDNRDATPPDMPIRTKQSDNGFINIENEGGFPVLTIKADQSSIWEKLNQFTLENWSLVGADEDSCTIKLSYNDQDARQREKKGFFKRIFSRKNYYSDYSGEYQFSCEESGKVTRIKFSKPDGTMAKTFLADSVMNQLYSQLE